MRIKLKLKSDSSYLTCNYNYPLSAAIYKLLNFGSKDFAAFLHDKGYKLNGKAYKLFTFSLKIHSFFIENNNFKLKSPHLDLFITTPIVDEFLRNFISGSLQRKNIEIYSNHTLTQLEIEQMELVPEPEFKNKMRFILNSPIVISTTHIQNGKVFPYYFRFHDDINEINRVLNNNLINKYKFIYNKEYLGKPLLFRWDKDYINKKITRKISIPLPNKKPVNIIGNMAPFYLEGNTDLIKTGYECGFGEKNSMGCGMAAVAN